MITAHLEPEGATRTFEDVRSVLKLLRLLGRRPNTVLVIRDGGLLTPDVMLRNGDVVTVRGVTSRG